jgi:hypothetical protein
LKWDAVGSILKQTKRKHQLTIKTCIKYVDKKSPAKNLQISSCSIADVVSYHKWMTSYNFFDFGVTCSTFISLCPNIRNTGLYFYLAFDFFNDFDKSGALLISNVEFE